MNQALLKNPLRVERITFKEPEEPAQYDCLVFVSGNFVIVADNEGDDAPTWYNVNEIYSMEGVRIDPLATRNEANRVRLFRDF